MLEPELRERRAQLFRDKAVDLDLDLLLVGAPVHAVVRGEDQHGVVPGAGLAQLVDEHPELGVGVLDRRLAGGRAQPGGRAADLVGVA